MSLNLIIGFTIIMLSTFWWVFVCVLLILSTLSDGQQADMMNMYIILIALCTSGHLQEILWVEQYSQLSLRRTPLGMGLWDTFVSILERCLSYKESNKGSKERQGPTLGVHFTVVSIS